MTLKARVRAALDQGWEDYQNGNSPDSDVPGRISSAVDSILATDSAPNRQMLVTIVAATAHDPDSNPASLQSAAGVDRRSQAKLPSAALTEFRDEKGLTMKLSQDPGVSNQWREERIDGNWVGNRRAHDRVWAEAFLDVVDWLADVEGSLRADRAQSLLELISYRLVVIAVAGALNYPRFKATPSLAMKLVNEFLASVGSRPDAIEAVVTAAARVLCSAMSGSFEVARGDVNSPDPIDILIVDRASGVESGIEVTDEWISLTKLKHEVLPAMLTHGLDQATVVSRGKRDSSFQEITTWIEDTRNTFGLRIDLVEIDAIETWLSFPGTPPELASRFLVEMGAELDKYSADSSRRAWYEILVAFTEAQTS